MTDQWTDAHDRALKEHAEAFRRLVREQGMTDGEVQEELAHLENVRELQHRDERRGTVIEANYYRALHALAAARQERDEIARLRVEEAISNNRALERAEHARRALEQENERLREVVEKRIAAADARLGVYARASSVLVPYKELQKIRDALATPPAPEPESDDE